MTEHSSGDAKRAEQCKAVGQAVIAALEPFATLDPGIMIIGIACALGAGITATGNPELSYMRATAAIRGIMSGELLD